MAYEWEQNDITIPDWEKDDAVASDTSYEDNDLLASEDPIGFFEAAGEDLATKIPFSPVGALEVADIALSARRLSGNKYDRAPLFTTYQTNEQLSNIRRHGGWVPSSVPGLPNKWTAEAQQAHDAKVVGDYFKKLDARQARGYTFGGRVGQIVSEMPAFVTEFVATGGLKKIGEKTAREAAERVLGRYATTTAGRAMIATGGFASGAGLRAAGMPHRAVEAIFRRQAPENMEIIDGEVKITGPTEDYFTSIWKGLADHYVEIMSEQAGEVLTPGFAKLAKKTPFMGAFVQRLQAGWLAKFPKKKPIDFLRKIQTKTGFHGVVGEVGEEYLGDVTRGLLNVDDFGAGPDASFLERMAAAVITDTENLPEMVVGFSVPGVTARAGARYLGKQAKKAQKLVDHVNELAQLEIDPQNQRGMETLAGFNPDLTVEEQDRLTSQYDFKKPGLFQYFTPKWLLNKLVGIEPLLKDVVAAEEAFQVEAQQLNSWVANIIPKIKKEKTLGHLPLEAEIKRELENEPEKISGAAIKLKSGEILEGRTHSEILKGVAESGRIISNDEFLPQLEGSGFMTNKGNFIVGDAAFDMAEQQEQIKSTGNKDVDQQFLSRRYLVAENLRPAPVIKTKAGILQKKIDGDTNPVHVMRDLLDTYATAPAFLNASEAKLFNQVRELTMYLRDRANVVRRNLGLPEIANVDAYITHWMDAAADAVLARDIPIHGGYLYKLMKDLPKNVKNKTAEKRKVRGEMEKFFSKDLGKLLRLMIAYDLKDIYIKQPYEAAWDELRMLRETKQIPKQVFRVAEEFLEYDIRKFEAPMDSAFNKTLKKPVHLLNKLLPASKIIHNPARNLFGFMRRLGILNGLGLKLKSPIRNFGQRLLLTDLMRPADIAKAQAVAFRLAKMPDVAHPITGEPIQLIELIRQQDWYQLALRKFADQDTIISGIERGSLFLYSKSHIGNLFLSNVELSAMAGYFDWQTNFGLSQDKESDHYKRAVKESKKSGTPLEQLLTQESDMLWHMREAVRRTQWEYFSTSMPVMYRSQFNRAMGMFQSWWMNYFFNHSREMTNRMLTNRNGLGRMLAKGEQFRAVKGLGTIIAIGKATEALLGIQMLKYLFAPLPGYLPPVPELVVGIIQYLAADDNKERSKAWKRIKYGLKFWIPFSAMGRDLNKFLSGEYDIGDFLVYKKQEKK